MQYNNEQLTYSETRDAGLKRQSEMGSVEQQERSVQRGRHGSLHKTGGEIEG